MNQLMQWIQDHKPSAHSVTAAWVMLDTLWYTNPQFHGYIIDSFNATPKWLHGLIAGAIIPMFVYWRTARTAKVTATVEPGDTGTAAVQATASTDNSASKL